MRFEHLIEINDPFNPLLTPLSRAQLWQGLVRRAEQPQEFVLGLLTARIHTRIEKVDSTSTRDEFNREQEPVVELRRTLDFGSFQVNDWVQLRPMKESVTHVEPGASWPASQLTISIEEPQPGALYLRFIYEDQEASDASVAVATGLENKLTELTATTMQLRNEAYRRADIDTVSRIRELVDLGALTAASSASLLRH